MNKISCASILSSLLCISMKRRWALLPSGSESFSQISHLSHEFQFTFLKSCSLTFKGRFCSSIKTSLIKMWSDQVWTSSLKIHFKKINDASEVNILNSLYCSDHMPRNRRIVYFMTSLLKKIFYCNWRATYCFFFTFTKTSFGPIKRFFEC